MQHTEAQACWTGVGEVRETGYLGPKKDTKGKGNFREKTRIQDAFGPIRKAFNTQKIRKSGKSEKKEWAFLGDIITSKYQRG